MAVSVEASSWEIVEIGHGGEGNGRVTGERPAVAFSGKVGKSYDNIP